MNSTIWKFPLRGGEHRLKLSMPAGARVLYATMQGEQAVLYAHVDPQALPVQRDVWIEPTGRITGFSDHAQPAGVLIIMGGSLMFHVFVEPEA